MRFNRVGGGGGGERSKRQNKIEWGKSFPKLILICGLFESKLILSDAILYPNYYISSFHKDDHAALKKSIIAMFPMHRTFFVSGRHRIGLDPLLMFLRETREKFLLKRQEQLELEIEQAMM